MLLLIITPRKFLDCNMDSGEIVYATVEEIIGRTGKSHQHAHRVSHNAILRLSLTHFCLWVFFLTGADLLNFGVFLVKAREEVLRKSRLSSRAP